MIIYGKAQQGLYFGDHDKGLPVLLLCLFQGLFLFLQRFDLVFVEYVFV